MRLGRVEGNVVCSKKHESLLNEKLLIVQPLNEKLEPVGKDIVATDIAQAGPGDIVFYEASREAALALDNPNDNVSDATIMGIVDSVDL